MAAAGVWKIVPDDGQDGGDVMFGLYLPKSWESIIKIKFPLITTTYHELFYFAFDFN